MAATNVIKFGKHLKELRIHLCQRSLASQGTRDFIETHYVNIKKNNPKFPMLIRECSGVQPKVYARYLYGKESSLPLSDLKSDQVLDAVQKLAVAE